MIQIWYDLNMRKELYQELYGLKKKLEKNEYFLELKRLDEELNNNEEVMKLAYKKEMAILDYEDALNHFGKNSEEARKNQQILAKCKFELDSHPLVKEYYQALKKVREIDSKINLELFEDFNHFGVEQ